jgi:hypothetical protein
MAGGGMKGTHWMDQHTPDPITGIALADAASSGGGVRPARGGGRVKTGLDPKAKKPIDNVPKKTPPTRKAPTRGRYVDEYARPA